MLDSHNNVKECVSEWWSVERNVEKSNRVHHWPFNRHHILCPFPISVSKSLHLGLNSTFKFEQNAEKKTRQNRRRRTLNFRLKMNQKKNGAHEDLIICIHFFVCVCCCASMITPLTVTLFPHFQIYNSVSIEISRRACRVESSSHTADFGCVTNGFTRILCSSRTYFDVSFFFSRMHSIISCFRVSTALWMCMFFFYGKKGKSKHKVDREKRQKKTKPNKIESNICVIWHLKKRSISDPFWWIKILFFSSLLFLPFSSPFLACTHTHFLRIIVVLFLLLLMRLRFPCVFLCVSDDLMMLFLRGIDLRKAKRRDECVCIAKLSYFLIGFWKFSSYRTVNDTRRSCFLRFSRVPFYFVVHFFLACFCFRQKFVIFSIVYRFLWQNFDFFAEFFFRLYSDAFIFVVICFGISAAINQNTKLW